MKWPGSGYRRKVSTEVEHGQVEAEIAKQSNPSPVQMAKCSVRSVIVVAVLKFGRDRLDDFTI